MESLSNPTRGLRVVAARYTGTYLPLIISLHFQFDIQSHHVFFPFNVQSHIFILMFRATISVSTFGSVICPQFDIQSHHVSFPFEVQSHIFILSFRVTFSVSSFGSIICPQLDIQSHHVPFSFDVQSRIFILAFRAALLVSASRAIIAPQFQRSEPLSLLSYDVQSHPSQFDIQICQFSVLAFRTTIFLQLDVQSQHRFSIMTFRVVLHSLAFIATISSQLVFRVIVPSQFGIQSYHPIMIGYSLPTFRRSKPQFTIRNSESSFIPRVQSHHIFSLTFRSISQSVIQSHHFPLVRHSELHSQHLEFLVFRVVFLFQFGIQSHIPSIQSHLSLLVRCSKPHYQHLGLLFSFNLAFRVILTIQSRFHQFQAFRVVSSF